MAADLTQTFMGKHGDKVAVGVAALILIGAIAWFVVLREPQGRLLEEAQRLVEDLRDKTQQEVQLREVLQPDERTALGIGRKGTTVADLQEAVTGRPPDYRVAQKLVDGIHRRSAPEEKEKEHFAPGEVLPVEQLAVAAGYGVTDAADVPNPQATLQTTEATYNDLVWAGVVGKLDLTRQAEIIQKPYLDKGGTAPLNRQNPILVTRVEVQRRQVKPDGTKTDWEAVTPAVSPEAASDLPAPPADNKDRAVVGKWYRGLVQFQAQIRRLPFFNILALGGGQTAGALAGDVTSVQQPDLSRFAAQAQPKPPAGGTPPGSPPGAGEGPATPPPPSEADDQSPFNFTTREKPSKEPEKLTEGPAREHVYATLAVNDANVDPGNTYEYRMKAWILNPVWSLPNVKPAEARWTLELESEWSEPTDPVTIPELSEFYFVGTFGERINLELHKWIHGQWLRVPSAPTYVGAPVVYVKNRARIAVPGKGDTVEKDVEIAPGVFLVDLVRQFPYQPRGGSRPINTNMLLYADEQGNLLRRIDWEDQERARNDRAEREKAPAAPAGGRRRRR